MAKYKRSELNRLADTVQPKDLLAFNEMVQTAFDAGDIEEDVPDPVDAALLERQERYKDGELDRLIGKYQQQEN